MGYVKLANMHEADTKVPYMMHNGEKIYFTADDAMFQNSHCLFIEYTDIIRSPYFIFLLLMAKSPEHFSKHYDLDEFKNYGVEELSEWYINRKNQNPLLDLVTDEVKENLNPYELDRFMNDQIVEHGDFITLSPLLNLGNSLYSVTGEVVKNIIIWYPYTNKVIEQDISDTFGDKVKFMTGDLFTVLDNVPQDTTYIFSDITNIDLLYEKKKLYLSSVVIPNEYRYNYIDEDTLKIDAEEYQKEVIFKLDFFSAVTEKDSE